MDKQDLQMKIGKILASKNVTSTLAQQKEVAAAIIEMLPPWAIAQLILAPSLEALTSYGFTCEAGKLENTVEFCALLELTTIKNTETGS